MLKHQVQQINQALPRGLTISNSVDRARVPRYPKHPFNIVQRPYEITPFFIAPVLSGETMRNLLLQARTVSTSLKNRLIGHHLEHYFFYVKLRDLADSDDLVSMLMDTGATSAVNTAGTTKQELYVRSGAPDYVKMCLDKVVEHYFRDEGDDSPHVSSATGLPFAQWTNYKSLLESFTPDDLLETGEITDGNPYPSHEKEYATWQYMRQMQLTEISFEDYLGTFGVRTPDAEIRRPELVRMVKNWTYPTNTVDGDGSINTQASWSVQERADKDRFFKEPGFVFGVTVARPKVFIKDQDQSAVSVLNNAFAWLPALMKDNPETSLQSMLGGSAAMPLVAPAEPAAGDIVAADSYWMDTRDLFVHGDQWLHHKDGETDRDVNAVSPEDWNTLHGRKYPNETDLQSLGTGDTLSYETDGIVSLNVLGTQIDMT